MPKITFIAHNGKEHVVDAPVGESVMKAAVTNSVRGIDADCGGACACATCHVYVDPAWVTRIKPPESVEQSMLDFAKDLKDNSRLSCQIEVIDALDGLIVRMPENQH